jgi:hypothetical protein
MYNVGVTIRLSVLFIAFEYIHEIQQEIHASKTGVRSRGSSVSIVSDYGLDDLGSIPDRGGASYPMGTGGP